MHEVHCSEIVGTDRISTVIARRGMHPRFWRLISELQTDLPINAINFLDVPCPGLRNAGRHAPGDGRSAGVLADFLDSSPQSRQIGAHAFAAVCAAVEPESFTPAGTTPPNLRISHQSTHASDLPFEVSVMTCWSISRSSVRSMTILFSLAFSYSNARGS